MRNIGLFFALIFLFACKQNPVDDSSKSNLVITETFRDSLLIYQSSNNGTADIKMALWTDSTFDFYMHIIPQPMTDDEETTINSSGFWENKNNTTHLTFIKNRPFISALFDSNYAKSREFTVLNDSVVEINSKLEAIHIWGVLCHKIEKIKKRITTLHNAKGNIGYTTLINLRRKYNSFNLGVIQV